MAMVVGDKARFAVEYELNLRHGGVWLYGALCDWVAGERVGDFDAGTSLRDALFQLEQLLKGRGRRENAELFALPPEQAAALLDDGLYRGEDESHVQRATAEEWARHDVRPALDIFAGWKLFLVEHEAEARLLVLREGQLVRVVALQAGEVDRVLAEVRDALDRLYQTEVAGERAPWRVVGIDTFAGDEYAIAQYATEAEAEARARAYLEQLERDQPTAESGGQEGIQDQVYIVGPGGSRRRVR